MNQSALKISKLFTLEEYLDYDDETDDRYELVDGELVEILTESPENCLIAKLLMWELAKHIPIARINLKDIAIEVSGRRAKIRLPDLTILSEDGYKTVMGQLSNTITQVMPPPILVVEVVSPKSENRDRNYRHKHTEYAARGITEYWIIDPELQQITLCLWVNGKYEDTLYKRDAKLKSTVVVNFDLSTEQILAFGKI